MSQPIDSANPSEMTNISHQCQACGWVYQPQQADPEHGIAVGTPFAAIAQIDAHWGCPLCGVGVAEFVKLDADNTDAAKTHTDSTINTATINTDTSQVCDVVVVGAGLAGWTVVDALRSLDNHIGITLITADSGDRYHKPMLSVAISQNKTPEQLIRTTGQDAAAAANIELLAQTQLQRMDSQAQQLHTDAGVIGYRSLVLALGAEPILPPSLPADAIHHVNHLHDFAALQQRLQQRKQHVAIIGAGMVGTEMAEDLCTAGHQVSLFDIQSLPLAQLLPAVAGERIAKALMDKGIEFFGSCLVTSVHSLPSGQQQLSYRHRHSSHRHPTHSAEQPAADDTSRVDTVITVDQIVLSTGLQVDYTLLTQAGIHADRRLGIQVDPNTLATNIANIYAIGDCMCIAGVPCRYVAPLRAQAATIAHELLGREHDGYQHKPPMIRLKSKAISVTATGLPRGDGDWYIISDSESQLQLEQHDQSGEVTATATLKQPLS